MIRSCVGLILAWLSPRCTRARWGKRMISQDLNGGARDANACKNRYSFNAPTVEETLEGNSVSVG